MDTAAAGAEVGDAPGADPVVTLPRRSVAWRLAAVAASLAVLVAAALIDTDDYFPLGRLSQYASAHERDGTVKSTYMLADSAAGRGITVPLGATGVGVGRAEIEGQLGRIMEDPSLLQGIANAWAELHPEQPPYTHLYLMRDIYHLVDGTPTGRPETVELARWRVEQ